MRDRAMPESSPEALEREVSEWFASGRATIPILPTVAAAVLTMTNDPEVDFGALATTIGNDQSLSGHVMRFANSPLLRLGAPIVSLQQAVARLGMRSVADAAIAACLGPKLFKAPLYASLIDGIWTESLATALWSREISELLRRDADASFLSGLLHQIGKPVVLQAVQEVLGPGVTSADGADPALVVEKHAVAAGMAVASKWHLPESVTITIGHVRDFRAAPAHRPLVAMVAAARVLALQSLAEDGCEDGAAVLLDRPEMAELGLDAGHIGQLLERTPSVRESLGALCL